MAHSKAEQFVTPYDINHIISKYGLAVGYPARILIMRWLAAEGPKRAGEISDFIELAKSTTSHHLRSLEHAGVITGVERGPNITYEFNKAGYAALRFYFMKIFDEIDGLEGDGGK